MKIFLNDRSIELLDSKPVQQPPETLVIEYTSPEDLQKAYKQFEREEDYDRLVVWSGKGSTRWREEFYQLFKKVEAAGGLVNNEKGEWLFIFRMGKWDLPKGKISGKETPEEAAIREVSEETGLSALKISGDLPATYHIYTRKGKTILKRTRWFSMEAKNDQSLVPQTEEDISEVRWVRKVEMGNILANTYASIRELLISEVAK